MPVSPRTLGQAIAKTMMETTERQQALEDFYCAMSNANHIPHKDMVGREVVCTPVAGAYETLAYWVIVVNGSPPRGTIIYEPRYDEFFLICDGSLRKLPVRHRAKVCNFVKVYLKDMERYQSYYMKDAKTIVVGGDADRVYGRTLGIVSKALESE
jgi:hypothetical protein